MIKKEKIIEKISVVEPEIYDSIISHLPLMKAWNDDEFLQDIYIGLGITTGNSWIEEINEFYSCELKNTLGKAFIDSSPKIQKKILKLLKNDR